MRPGRDRHIPLLGCERALVLCALLTVTDEVTLLVVAELLHQLVRAETRSAIGSARLAIAWFTATAGARGCA